MAGSLTNDRWPSSVCSRPRRSGLPEKPRCNPLSDARRHPALHNRRSSWALHLGLQGL